MRKNLLLASVLACFAATAAEAQSTTTTTATVTAKSTQNMTAVEQRRLNASLALVNAAFGSADLESRVKARTRWTFTNNDGAAIHGDVVKRAFNIDIASTNARRAPDSAFGSNRVTLTRRRLRRSSTPTMAMMIARNLSRLAPESGTNGGYGTTARPGTPAGSLADAVPYRVGYEVRRAAYILRRGGRLQPAGSVSATNAPNLVTKAKMSFGDKWKARLASGFMSAKSLFGKIKSGFKKLFGR